MTETTSSVEVACNLVLVMAPFLGEDRVLKSTANTDENFFTLFFVVNE